MSTLRGKQKYTRDEIVEILKRHAAMMKDDDKFVDYIFDLATFYLEYRNLVRTTAEADASARPVRDPNQPKWLSRTSDRESALSRTLSKNPRQRDENATCKMCGSPTGGKVTCPNCGNMAV